MLFVHLFTDILATFYEDLEHLEDPFKQFENCLQKYEEKGDEAGKQRTVEKMNALKEKR